MDRASLPTIGQQFFVRMVETEVVPNPHAQAEVKVNQIVLLHVAGLLNVFLGQFVQEMVNDFKLGYLSPARFAAQLNPSPAPVGLRPPFAGDGQTQNPKIHSTTTALD